MFVFNLANHFCEDKIYLLTNPKRISPDFPKNVKCLTMASWFLSILGYVEGKLNNKILKKYLYCYIKTFPQKYGKRFDANVRIGGSLFMDKSGGGGRKSRLQLIKSWSETLSFKVWFRKEMDCF